MTGCSTPGSVECRLRAADDWVLHSGSAAKFTPSAAELFDPTRTAARRAAPLWMVVVVRVSEGERCRKRARTDDAGGGTLRRHRRRAGTAPPYGVRSTIDHAVAPSRLTRGPAGCTAPPHGAPSQRRSVGAVAAAPGMDEARWGSRGATPHRIGSRSACVAIPPGPVHPPVTELWGDLPRSCLEGGAMAEQLSAMLGLPPAEAQGLLEAAGGDVELAMNLYLDGGGGGGGGGAVGS
eukprot:gene33897-47929_t